MRRSSYGNVEDDYVADSHIDVDDEFDAGSSVGFVEVGSVGSYPREIYPHAGAPMNRPVTSAVSYGSVVAGFLRNTIGVGAGTGIRARTAGTSTTVAKPQKTKSVNQGQENTNHFPKSASWTRKQKTRNKSMAADDSLPPSSPSYRHSNSPSRQHRSSPSVASSPLPRSPPTLISTHPKKKNVFVSDQMPKFNPSAGSPLRMETRLDRRRRLQGRGDARMRSLSPALPHHETIDNFDASADPVNLPTPFLRLPVALPPPRPHTVLGHQHFSPLGQWDDSDSFHNMEEGKGKGKSRNRRRVSFGGSGMDELVISQPVALGWRGISAMEGSPRQSTGPMVYDRQRSSFSRSRSGELPAMESEPWNMQDPASYGDEDVGVSGGMRMSESLDDPLALSPTPGLLAGKVDIVSPDSISNRAVPTLEAIQGQGDAEPDQWTFYQEQADAIQAGRLAGNRSGEAPDRNADVSPFEIHVPPGEVIADHQLTTVELDIVYSSPEQDTDFLEKASHSDSGAEEEEDDDENQTDGGLVETKSATPKRKYSPELLSRINGLKDIKFFFMFHLLKYFRAWKGISLGGKFRKTVAELEVRMFVLANPSIKEHYTLARGQIASLYDAVIVREVDVRRNIESFHTNFMMNVEEEVSLDTPDIGAAFRISYNNMKEALIPDLLSRRRTMIREKLTEKRISKLRKKVVDETYDVDVVLAGYCKLLDYMVMGAIFKASIRNMSDIFAAKHLLTVHSHFLPAREDPCAIVPEESQMNLFVQNIFADMSIFFNSLPRVYRIYIGEVDALRTAEYKGAGKSVANIAMEAMEANKKTREAPVEMVGWSNFDFFEREAFSLVQGINSTYQNAQQEFVHIRDDQRIKNIKFSDLSVRQAVQLYEELDSIVAVMKPLPLDGDYGLLEVSHECFNKEMKAFVESTTEKLKDMAHEMLTNKSNEAFASLQAIQASLAVPVPVNAKDLVDWIESLDDLNRDIDSCSDEVVLVRVLHETAVSKLHVEIVATESNQIANTIRTCEMTIGMWERKKKETASAITRLSSARLNQYKEFEKVVRKLVQASKKMKSDNPQCNAKVAIDELVELEEDIERDIFNYNEGIVMYNKVVDLAASSAHVRLVIPEAKKQNSPAVLKWVLWKKSVWESKAAFAAVVKSMQMEGTDIKPWRLHEMKTTITDYAKKVKRYQKKQSKFEAPFNERNDFVLSAFNRAVEKGLDDLYDRFGLEDDTEEEEQYSNTSPNQSDDSDSDGDSGSSYSDFGDRTESDGSEVDYA